MEKATKDALVARFETELGKIQNPGIQGLLGYIRKSDFYTAPASTKHHLATEGGLLQHSLNVLDALRGLLTWNPDDNGWEYRVAGEAVDTIPDATVIITALLHDICKTHFYSISYRNVKNEKTKRWEKAPYYTVNDKMPLGHGAKSAMIIKEYIPLTRQELYAIWWHMGMPESYEDRMSYNAAVEAHPFILALHTADMMASHFMEGDTGNKTGFTFQDLQDETGEAVMDEHLAEAEAAASREPDYQDAPPVGQQEDAENGQEAAVSATEEQAGRNTAQEPESDCAIVAPVWAREGRKMPGSKERSCENCGNTRCANSPVAFLRDTCVADGFTKHWRPKVEPDMAWPYNRARISRAKTWGRHKHEQRWVQGTAAHLVGTDPDGIVAGVLRSEWHIFTEQGTHYKIDLKTLGDWSGLYDKNGIPIFEGDVLRFMDKCGIWTAAVQFERGLFGLDCSTRKQVRNPKGWNQTYNKVRSRWWAVEWGYEEWGTAFTFRQPLAQRTIFSIPAPGIDKRAEAYETNWRNAWHKKHGYEKYVVDAVVVGNRFDNPELLE